MEEEDEDDLECYDKEIDYVNPDLLSCEKVRVQRFSFEVIRCASKFFVLYIILNSWFESLGKYFILVLYSNKSEKKILPSRYLFV